MSSPFILNAPLPHGAYRVEITLFSDTESVSVFMNGRITHLKVTVGSVSTIHHQLSNHSNDVMEIRVWPDTLDVTHIVHIVAIHIVSSPLSTIIV